MVAEPVGGGVVDEVVVVGGVVVGGGGVIGDSCSSEQAAINTINRHVSTRTGCRVRAGT